MGRKLRYKILVHNFSIVEVLYNTGATIEKMPFTENKLDLENNQIM